MADSEPTREKLVLRPFQRYRVGSVAIAAVMLAFAAWAATYSAWAYPAVAFLMVCLLVFGIRLSRQESGTTELDEEGLLTRTPVLGYPMQYVRWEDIRALTYCDLGGLRGPNTVRVVAWQAERAEVFRRRGILAGGVNAAGFHYDGALPEGYGGFDEVRALLEERVAAARSAAATSSPAA